MFLTAVDVVMRYAVSAPIRGSFEISELMLALLIFSGFPLVSLQNQHVSIGILDRYFSFFAEYVVDAISHLVCFVLFGGMALLLLRQASRMTMTSDLTIALHIPILPLVYVLFVLVLLTALVHVMQFATMLVEGPRPTADRNVSESQV